MEEYIEKFEELMTKVMCQIPQATEAYYTTVFVGGLKDELKHLVKMFNP